MSADIVNLNQFRKRKARAAQDTRAAVNRRRHGETKAEKTAREAERARDERALAGKRLEDEDQPA